MRNFEIGQIIMDARFSYSTFHIAINKDSIGCENDYLVVFY